MILSERSGPLPADFRPRNCCARSGLSSKVTPRAREARKSTARSGMSSADASEQEDVNRHFWRSSCHPATRPRWTMPNCHVHYIAGKPVTCVCIGRVLAWRSCPNLRTHRTHEWHAKARSDSLSAGAMAKECFHPRSPLIDCIAGVHPSACLNLAILQIDPQS